MDEQIRQLAYFKWQEAGCPSGRSEEFWLAAERQVARRKAFVQEKKEREAKRNEAIKSSSWFNFLSDLF